MPWRLLRFALNKKHPEPRMFTFHEKLKSSYDVVIIGAGGHGLSAAYYLAKEHGIASFMYYYYWFSGERVLNLPIEKMRAMDLDMPYCIMWANENWTRRWDGRSADILVGQDYSKVPAAEFIDDVMEFLLRHGQFIAQLVLDALAGEQAAIRFISGIHTRHPLVLLETIREAQQEGSVLMGDPMNILIYLVCCGGAPFILSGQLQVHDSKAARPVLDLLGSILNDPESARQRMTWALRGIRRV